MIKNLIVIVLTSLLGFACVPNKKIVYLQKEDVNKRDLPKDTVVRSHNLQKFEYKIQPNDVLSVDFASLTAEDFDFFKKKDTRSYQLSSNTAGILISGELVDDQGNIEFPVVGKIQVAGLTIFEAQEKVRKIANQFLQGTTVKIRLINFRFTVLGEVIREGTITSYNNRISLIEALGLSGGLSDLADRSKVKVIRQVGNVVETQYINLLDENFIDSQYYYVHQNDIIVVPPLKQRPFRKYAAQNASVILSVLTTILLIVNFINN